MRMPFLLAPLVLAAAALTACGDDNAKTSGTPSSAKTTTTLRISNYLYDPQPAAVKTGTKVVITNADDAPHTVTDRSAARTFDSGTIKGQKKGSVTFSKAGTYAYFCEFHPTMAGKVTVTE